MKLFTNKIGILSIALAMTVSSCNKEFLNAVPELDLDGEIIQCYLEADNNPEEWDSGTFWPESALSILGTVNE